MCPNLRGLAARGRPRRCESALQNPQGAPSAPPGAVGGAWACGFCCAFASPWPAARCESTQARAHANYFFPCGGSGNNAWTCSARLAKVRRKHSKTHSPRRPLRRLGGAEGAPCGFWSALSHRLGQPRAASPRRLGRMLTTFPCGQLPTTRYRLYSHAFRKP